MTSSDQVLRTGVLFKKGSGSGPFGRRNWKPRYFVLTPTKLTYYTYEDGDLKGEVDLTRCSEQSLEVMPADSMKTGSSASTIWRIAINSADRRLLVAAGTEMEMNGWVEQLRVAFCVNSGQPLPPQRQSLDHAAAHFPTQGPSMNTGMGGDLVRNNSITDFQNFASARRSVGSAARASLGSNAGYEFRLSDEHERIKQAERQHAEMEAERRHQEELLLAQQRSQAEARRKQEQEKLEKEQEEQRMKQEKEQEEHRLQQQMLAERTAQLLEEQQRMEELLEEQRRLKREKHERERLEAERQLELLELEEQEKRHDVEIRRHFDEENVVEVEIHRRAVPQQEPVVSSPVQSPVASGNAMTTATPPHSSLFGDAKKEAMARQQAEHSKRREATIQEEKERMRKDFLEQKKQQEDALRASHVTNKPAAPSTPPRISQYEQRTSPANSSPSKAELVYEAPRSPTTKEIKPRTTSFEF